MPPTKITELLEAKWANQVLKTALELNVFSELKNGALSWQDLSCRLALDQRGAKLLLDCLVALEFLAKKDEKYSLTKISELYLVSDSQLFLGKYILAKDDVELNWQQLTKAMRTGEPVCQVNQDSKAEEFFPQLASSIFPLNFTTAQMVADALGANKMPSPVRILDLAAGSAVWSIPFAQANPHVTVDALDFPAVLNVTASFAGKYGVADRYTYLSGNWRNVPLENSVYDLVILGHILHSEGKEMSRQLLAACAGALKSGGRLIIAEFIASEQKTGPSFPCLFALNMFLATTAGCVFSLAELEEMLSQSGFEQVERLELPFWGSQAPVVTAIKS